MAFLNSQIGRVAVKEQSDWGTAESSFAAANFVECEVSLPDLASESLTTESFRGQFHHAEYVAGAKTATMTLRMPMHGWSATTPTETPSSLHVDAVLLKNLMGGSAFGPFIEAANVNGGTDTTVEAASGTGAQSDVSNALLVALDSTSPTGYNVGHIKTMTDGGGGDDTYTFVDALDASTDASKAVYGSTTISMQTAATNPLTVQWVGSETAAAFRLWDAVVSGCTISLNPREQPMLEVEIQAANWTIDGAGGAVGTYAYSLPQMPVMVGSNYARVRLNGASVNANSIEVSIEADVVTIGSHSGNQGVARLHHANKTATVTLVTPLEDSIQAAQPGTTRGIFQVDLAGVPGRAMSVLMPSTCLIEQQTISDEDGIIASTQVLGVYEYTDDSAGTGTGVGTSARIAFL